MKLHQLFQRSPRRAVGAAAGLAFAFGCASQVKMTQIAERTYSVECKGSLANCLVRVQETCLTHGYDVLSATERRETTGASPGGAEFVKASAIVRCREAVPLFGEDPNPQLPVVAASASSAPPPVVTAPAVAPSPLASAPPASPGSPSADAGTPPAVAADAGAP